MAKIQTEIKDGIAQRAIDFINAELAKPEAEAVKDKNPRKVLARMNRMLYKK